jgi:hypothetical protein
MNACKNAIRRSPNRRGYALVAVLMFNVLFLMLMGVAWRQMVGVIRVATLRAEQVQRDEGVVCAMARAMHMLETGRPPIGSASTYQCYTTIGPDFYLLTFTPGTDPSVEAWSVTVAAQSTAPSGVPFKLDTF